MARGSRVLRWYFVRVLIYAVGLSETTFGPCSGAFYCQRKARRHSHPTKLFTEPIVCGKPGIRMVIVWHDIQVDTERTLRCLDFHTLVQHGVQLLLMPAQNFACSFNQR